MYVRLQTMSKTSIKFQNKWHKTVRGVANTRYLVYNHFGEKKTMFIQWKK